MAAALKVPLIGVDHLAAHAESIHLEWGDVPFPWSASSRPADIRAWLSSAPMEPTRSQSFFAGLAADHSTSVAPGVPVTGGLRVWPNPVRGEATMSFELDTRGAVMLDVYDVAGRRVWSSPRVVLGAGPQTMCWSGRHDLNAPTASGVYFLHLHGAGIDVTRRVVLVD